MPICISCRVPVLSRSSRRRLQPHLDKGQYLPIGPGHVIRDPPRRAGAKRLGDALHEFVRRGIASKDSGQVGIHVMLCMRGMTSVQPLASSPWTWPSRRAPSDPVDSLGVWVRDRLRRWAQCAARLRRWHEFNGGLHHVVLEVRRRLRPESSGCVMAEPCVPHGRGRSPPPARAGAQTGGGFGIITRHAPHAKHDVPCPIPRRTRTRASVDGAPSPHGLPLMTAGSASTTIRFEACSGFTRVTARWIAQPHGLVARRGSTICRG